MSDDTPVCPYCEHEEPDAWDIYFGCQLNGTVTITCGACGVEYLCTIVCTLNFYSRQKLEPKE